jgi:endonuclease YncB( thermonuclease family)
MQILRSFILAAVAAIQISPPPMRSGPVLVTAVFDGDTIDVATIGHVRLLGIDAPEISHGLDTAAPFAREARQRLADLVLRRYVRLEFDGARNDVYGRRLAYLLTEDGTLINAVLLREGLARISARTLLSRLDELRRAEAQAQDFRRGMWGLPPQMPSQEYAGRPRSSGAARTAAKLRPRTSKVAAARRKSRVVKARRPVRVRKKRFWTIISSHDETLAAAGDSGRAECDGGRSHRGGPDRAAEERAPGRERRGPAERHRRGDDDGESGG